LVWLRALRQPANDVLSHGVLVLSTSGFARCDAKPGARRSSRAWHERKPAKFFVLEDHYGVLYGLRWAIWTRYG